MPQNQDLNISQNLVSTETVVTTYCPQSEGWANGNNRGIALRPGHRRAAQPDRLVVTFAQARPPMVALLARILSRFGVKT